MAEIRWCTGETGRSEPLVGDRPLGLGRESDNHFVLTDPGVSRHHARLVRRGDGWAIEDLGSANGTRVNGTVVPPGDAGTEIQTGNTLMFGTITAEIIDSGELYDSL